MARQKLKTHRGAAKRFKLTATGKVTRCRSGLRHLLAKKTSRRKRALSRGALVHKADKRNVKALLPYG